jgi:hypothetical protein
VPHTSVSETEFHLTERFAFSTFFHGFHGGRSCTSLAPTFRLAAYYDATGIAVDLLMLQLPRPPLRPENEKKAQEKRREIRWRRGGEELVVGRKCLSPLPQPTPQETGNGKKGTENRRAISSFETASFYSRCMCLDSHFANGPSGLGPTADADIATKRAPRGEMGVTSQRWGLWLRDFVTCEGEGDLPIQALCAAWENVPRDREGGPSRSCFAVVNFTSGRP